MNPAMQQLYTVREMLRRCNRNPEFALHLLDEFIARYIRELHTVDSISLEYLDHVRERRESFQEYRDKQMAAQLGHRMLECAEVTRRITCGNQETHMRFFVIDASRKVDQP